MIRLLWICRILLLLPMSESPNPRDSPLKTHFVLNLYNKTHNWWMDPNPWQRAIMRKPAINLGVIVKSYDIGLTVLAVAEATSQQAKFQQLDPSLAYYYTTAYRWILRLLSMYPDIIHGEFIEAHKVWRQRFHHENALVPKWLRNALAWVDKDTWDLEAYTLNRYNTHVKAEFENYDRYPPKKIKSEESFSNLKSIFYPGPPD